MIFPFSISDPLHSCCDIIKQTSLRKQQAISEPTLMKMYHSPENDCSCMFLEEDSKGKEEDPLSFLENLGEMFS